MRKATRINVHFKVGVIAPAKIAVSSISQRYAAEGLLA